MRSVIETQPVIRYTPTDISDFTIVGGADAWVDTDCSAALGLNPGRVYIIGVVAAAGQFTGARAHGVATQPFKFTQSSLTLFSRTDAAGHIDFFRSAANNIYTVIGYFE